MARRKEKMIKGEEEKTKKDQNKYGEIKIARDDFEPKKGGIATKSGDEN